MACDAPLAGELAAWIARVRRRIASAGPVLKPALELELGLLESLVKDVRALERPDGPLAERVAQLAVEVGRQIGGHLPDNAFARCLHLDLADIATAVAALERQMVPEAARLSASSAGEGTAPGRDGRVVSLAAFRSGRRRDEDRGGPRPPRPHRPGGGRAA